ncbi:MAG: UDP-N-acetylmuramoyl-tripeptide--D-alanyl-D-alanine ligase [Eubacteriales bacterium]|nr:UDP-N-acetylmuramoyl-tripeptide--D-alanyl-D-alanine ligase [Eubacteriales bacterium]
MKSFTLREILTACGGEFFGETSILEKEVSHITTDSRKIVKDCVFAAIEGERVDGHNFIPQCIEMGAICTVCEKTPPNHLPHILVKSTKAALIKIAAAYRMKFEIPFVGISGSVGKTTTKEMISSVLSEKFSVMKTQGNFNNDLGVPITLFTLEESHEAAVVEMGISDFGEMSVLASMSRPDVCVITNIGACHLENLKDLDGVKKAKTEMFGFMNEGGVAILSGDDEKLREIKEVQGKPPVFFGLSEGCDFTAKDIESNNTDETSFTVCYRGGSFRATVYALGKHMVTNALAAAAVGKHFGLSDDEIKKGIADYKTVGSRANVIKTDKLTIIDDCYNANPVSMKASMDTLSGFEGRRVAIVGDMKELGENELPLHREVGRFAVEKRLDLIIAVGDLALEIYKEARPYIDSEWFKTVEEAKLELHEMLTIGDTVLVKASHSMHFEEIVDYLKEM